MLMPNGLWPKESDQVYSVDDLQHLTYYDTHVQLQPYPSTGQGSATVVQDSSGNILDETAYNKDIDAGFTNPNLHRRVDIQDPPEQIPDTEYNPDDPDSVDKSYLNHEIAPHEIDISIRGKNSYRTTTYTVHNEESITTEIP